MNKNTISTLKKIARIYGTPCFVYFYDQLVQRILEINNLFGGRFQISYAVKANPNPFILKKLLNMVSCLDVSSLGELNIALKAGWTGKEISFTGPGKTDEELKNTIQKNSVEVVLESTGEAERLNKLALDYGIKQEVLIRISPTHVPKGFGGHMAGRPCAFGIDEEELEKAINHIQKLKNLKLIGFHSYSGTQCLNSEAIIENWQIFIELFKKAVAISGIHPKKLIFGSGLGIPYHQNEKAINLDSIALKFNSIIDELMNDKIFSETKFILETGRYLIGESGIYITRVINIKMSRGTKIIICDGGMNHNLAACGLLGMVIPRNYKFIKIDWDKNGKLENYQIAGPLCTALDTLGRNVELPCLNEGDLIGVLCTGAYGLTSSPFQFISHKPPKEILVVNKNKLQNVEDITQLYISKAKPFDAHTHEKIL